eukprot:9496823-Alexandrium_andersonii.AAC.1
MKGSAVSSPACTQPSPGSVIAAAQGSASQEAHAPPGMHSCSMKLQRGSRDGLRVGELGAKP